MKKSLMNNIKNFVDSNVRHRIDKASHNNCDFFSDDLILVERQFEDLRHICNDAEKKISTLLQSIQAHSSSSQISAYTHNVQSGIQSFTHNINQQSAHHSGIAAQSTGGDNRTNLMSPCRSQESLSYSTASGSSIRHPVCGADLSLAVNQHLSEDIQQKHKKLPNLGFLRFLVKTSNKLKPNSLLSIPVNHCAQLQAQLTKLFLTYEQTIEKQCLKPLQTMLEIDVPSVVKLRRLFIKSHNDLESFKAKYNGASQKQLHSQQQQQQLHQQSQTSNSSNSYTVTQTSLQQVNANKLDQLRKELDDAVMRFEQAKDAYETEIYGFVCRETELVNLVVRFYQLQAEYHQQVGAIIERSLPTLASALACTPRKVAFGTAIDEHLRCTNRVVSPVVELSVHLLHCQGLREEGLFRIPGSAVKIKKLKNAINAWFVNPTTLVNETDANLNAPSTCVSALHELFKTIIGRPPELSTSSNIANTKPTDITADSQQPVIESGLPFVAQQQSETHNDSEMILDVHSIAGLLKLYLRELPEPLFTYALYERWIDALHTKVAPNTGVLGHSDTNETHDEDTNSGQQERNRHRCDALKDVIADLPKSNYDNLRHLIKFLHLLTNNREHNKMTSTNLAIAMAPSLIWSKPVTVETNHNLQESTGDCPAAGKSGAPPITLTAQQQSMSSFGLSASLHAMLLDAMISNAEKFFPGPVEFDLPDFKGELSLAVNSKSSMGGGASPKRIPDNAGRPLKSISPAGLSIASSSSFSSNASNPGPTTLQSATGMALPTNSSDVYSNSVVLAKTHSRRGGSMEDLIDDCIINNKDRDSNTALTTRATTAAAAPNTVSVKQSHSTSSSPCDEGVGCGSTSIRTNHRAGASTVQRGNAFKSNRPVSVQIRREDYVTLSNRQQQLTTSIADGPGGSGGKANGAPPPVPPVPTARSRHFKQLQQHSLSTTSQDAVSSESYANSRSSESSSELGTWSVLKKPLVPPPPAKTAQENAHEQQRLHQEANMNADRPSSFNAPKPVSRRGTGRIISNETTTSAATNASNVGDEALAGTTRVLESKSIIGISPTRPNVPPPLRPDTKIIGSSVDVAKSSLGAMSDLPMVDGNSRVGGDITTSLSLTVVGDGLSDKSVSPIVSLSSVTPVSYETSSESSFISSDDEQVTKSNNNNKTLRL